MKYNADYFIAKFEAIPEELWNDNGYYREGNKCCAYGHCGKFSIFQETDESRSLYELTRSFTLSNVHIAPLNDGNIAAYQQPTPKQRVLVWLRDAKEAGL